jgi:hypothetical protein
MKRTKLGIALALVVGLLTLVLVQAQAEKIPKLEKAPRKVTSTQPKQQPQPTQPSPQVKPAETAFQTVPLSVPEFTTNQYVLVTGVLDEFGRPSESDSFKIQISCGGQPTPVGIPAGISESSNYGVRHGYAHTAAVLHGDVTANGIINVGDVVYLRDYLYAGGDPPIPLESGDVNCDGIINLGDLIYLQNYLWRGGPPPCDPPS